MSCMKHTKQKGAYQGAFFNMVRVAGLEPARLTPADFKSAVYTNSTTLACSISSLRCFQQVSPGAKSRRLYNSSLYLSQPGRGFSRLGMLLPNALRYVAQVIDRRL